MSILNNLLRESDVVLEGLRGSVDHNGGETTVDAGLAELEGIAVIKVKSDRNLRILDNSSLNQLYKVGVVRISASSLGNLKNNRAVQLAGCFRDTLYNFHVVYVEGTDGVTTVVSLSKHFFCCN